MAVAKFSQVTKTLEKQENDQKLAKVEDPMDAFIGRAPDGELGVAKQKLQEEKASCKWKLKGKKVVITHTIYPQDLERLDKIAASMGIKRAAYINMLITKALLEHEID